VKYEKFIDEAGYGQLQDYPVPSVALDTTNYRTSNYMYHTFALELLPNEARFLQDGNVVYRFPDRMIPPTDKHYNWITNMYRSPVAINPGEADIEPAVLAAQVAWFKNHVSSHPWYWDNAAHELIDYLRLYDVPSNVSISGLPH
jgi:hypothetical protein